MGLSPIRALQNIIWRAAPGAADDSRIIEGVATSSRTDHYGDVIEPKGAQFQLPMPLLIQHDHALPIGKVLAAKIGANEITITAQVANATAGLDYVETAWKQITSGLVSGLSIGAKPLKAEPILDNKGGWIGNRYTSWQWLELSAVTIPANSDSNIDLVKMFDPWGAVAYANSHDPRADLARAPELEGPTTYETIRAQAVEALNVSGRALYRR